LLRTIILPAGISVLGGLKELKVELTPGHETAQLTGELLQSLSQAVDTLSAELSMLKALNASSDDEAVFLATDTDDGERAAKQAEEAKAQANADRDEALKMASETEGQLHQLRQETETRGKTAR